MWSSVPIHTRTMTPAMHSLTDQTFQNWIPEVEKFNAQNSETQKTTHAANAVDRGGKEFASGHAAPASTVRMRQVIVEGQVACPSMWKREGQRVFGVVGCVVALGGCVGEGGTGVATAVPFRRRGS